MINQKLAWALALVVLSLSACTGTRSAKSGEASSSSMQFRNKVVSFGKEQVGTAYKYAGQSPSTGFDCSGFTSYVLGHYKVKVSPASAVQAKEGQSVSLDRVLPGDLIFFGEGSKISHVALVVKRSKEGIVCVHSTTSRGVIVENVSSSTYWKPKILFARDVISK